MDLTRLLGVISIVLAASCFADVSLMGSNIPNQSVLGGDFEAYQANWRRPEPSPNWTTQIISGGGKVGFAEGTMMINGPTQATFESVVLNHTELQSLNPGDVLAWRFAANAEYPCDGRVSLALVFGDKERFVAGRVKVPNGPEKPQTYEGFYTVTADDAERGMPRLKFTLESTHKIIVYVHWVDLKLLKDGGVSELAANALDSGIELTWHGDDGSASTIYRSADERLGFEKQAEGVKGNCWIDTSAINGKTYYYAIKQDSSVSSVSKARKIDSVAPAAPLAVQVSDGNWVTRLSWETQDSDIAYYKIYRESNGEMVCIAPHAERNSFTDQLPIKGVDNVYAVQAVDYSGNAGPLSRTAAARTEAVAGASFSDLLLPMPIHQQLRSDVWGADGVLPRDPDNGIEDPFWSYWGGKIMYDPSDGRYHINVVRWPEGDRKGHWAWPYSTAVYAVSDKPTGPFKVVRDLAYDYQDGIGHNTNIIPLNDGRYAMYSLVHFVPMIFTSDSIKGPWELEGEIKINLDSPMVDQGQEYLYRNNLTGLHCEDGSFLMISKRGASMRSTTGILGPYEVLTKDVNHNPTLPKYLRTGCEDPAFWYDGLQYHMLINQHMSYRSLYFRSPDGVNWKYETGFGFTPTSTIYEDGTRTFWYKVERPNVLQDEFGRATHLSLAAVDVKKRDDYGNDAHSSKHLVIPLVVPKRMTMLNTPPVSAATPEIKVLIHSEAGFEAQEDLDLGSLRFGGSEAVNFGGGAKLRDTEPHPDGLTLVFAGDNGLTDQNFVGKLIGQTKSGKLVVGYCKLAAE